MAQETKLSADAFLDLQSKLRELTRLLAQRGVNISEDAPLVDLIQAVGQTAEEPEPVKVYKNQQFDRYPGQSLSTLAFAPNSPGYYIFWQSQLDRLPRMTGLEAMTSFEGFAMESGRLLQATLGELTKANRIDLIFASCGNLRQIDLSTTSALLNANRAFHGCSILQRIDGVLDFSQTNSLSQTFAGCSALVEVRIKGLKESLQLHECPKLSKESLRYLVDNLTPSTGKSLTLSRAVFTADRPWAEQLARDAQEKGFAVTYR